MGPKRWILTLFIIALVIGLLVLLFVQSGVDTRIVETLLPRVEERFKVKLRYEGVEVSLTSVSFSNLSIYPPAGKNPLINVGRLSLHLRVGPLLKGDLDVTSVRLDELRLLMGAEASGATPTEWADFVRNLSDEGGAEGVALPGIRKAPEIHIASGSITGRVGGISAVVDSFQGRSRDGQELSISVHGYRLKEGDTYLVRGGTSSLTVHRADRKLAVQSTKPSFELPGTPEGMALLEKDLSDALKTLGLSAQKDAPAKAKEPSPRWSAALEISGGTLTFIFPESAKNNLTLADLTGRIALGRDARIHFVGGGGLPTTSSHWTVEGDLPDGAAGRIVLEVPDLPMQPFAEVLVNRLPRLKAIDFSKGVADGRVAVSLSPDRAELTWEGQAAIAGISITHPSLSTEPIVNLNGHVDFKTRWNREEELLQIERLTLSQGLVRLGVVGQLQRSPLVFDLQITLPPTSCKQLLSAIPGPLRDRIENPRIDGQISMSLKLGINLLDPEATVLEGALNNRCTITDFGGLPNPAEFRSPFAYNAYDKDGGLFRLETGPGSGRYAPLAEISPYLIEAVLTTEDGKFRAHEGMTLPEVRRAIILNLKNKGALHGASTITMQLAKNLFLSRERTVSRKLQELFFTWYLESQFSKDDILELYFNVIEFGPSIYGIVDASRHYFGREPSELNLLESVFLIKLLPSPVKRHEAWENGRLSDAGRRTLNGVMGTMLKRGRITKSEFEAALLDEIQFYKEGDPPPDPRLPAGREPLRLIEDENGDWVEETPVDEGDGGWGEN